MRSPVAVLRPSLASEFGIADGLAGRLGLGGHHSPDSVLVRKPLPGVPIGELGASQLDWLIRYSDYR